MCKWNVISGEGLFPRVTSAGLVILLIIFIPRLLNNCPSVVVNLFFACNKLEVFVPLSSVWEIN